MSQLKNRCTLQINRSVLDVLKADNIKSYLDLVSKNHQLSFANQVLLWRQFPNASKVAGENAWLSKGRTIKPDATPLVLLKAKFDCESEGIYETDEFGHPLCDEKSHVPIYKIEPEWSSDFIPVAVLDISQTEGADDSVNSVPTCNFEQRIKYITDMTTIDVPLSELPTKYSKGFLSIDESTIYLKENLTDLERELELLEQYISFCIDDDEFNHADLVKILVKYTISQYFGFNPSVGTFLFMSAIEDESLDQKKLLLSKLQYYTTKIIQDLTGYYLDFNETAIVNYLLDTDEFNEMTIKFEKISRTIENEDLIFSMRNLRDKLLCSRDGFIEQLYTDRIKKNIYSFPAYKIETDPKYI